MIVRMLAVLVVTSLSMSDACLDCLNATNSFLISHGLTASATSICQKSNRCSISEAFMNSAGIFETALKTIVTEVVAPFDEEGGRGLEEAMSVFDRYYGMVRGGIAEILEDEEVRKMMVEIVSKTAEAKPTTLSSNDSLWFWLQIAEIFTNNENLNKGAQRIFENLFNVTWDAE